MVQQRENNKSCFPTPIKGKENQNSCSQCLIPRENKTEALQALALKMYN